MSLLAEIRAAGGVVELAGLDGLTARNLPAELIQQAKDRKEWLVATLRAEAFDGIQYVDSPYYIQLDSLYLRAKRLSGYAVIQTECQRLMALCQEIDDVMRQSYSAGVELLNKGEMMELADAVAIKTGWMLAGARLRAAAVEEMELAFAPKLNMAALD